MQKLQQFFLVAVLLCGSAKAQRATDIGPIMVAGNSTIKVTVTGTGELDGLARVAFGAHGRYTVWGGSAPAFDLRFSTLSPTQVRVDVSKAGVPFFSQTASGSSTRNAFFRAADAAVKATCGLPGFFASKLAFVVSRGGKSEIYIGDLFLGDARQITHDNSQALTPRWSPDGSKLLYTSYYRSGYPDVFLIDLASLQRSNFVSFKGTNSGARFSPNGSQVAMVLSGEGNPEIYVSNAQGRQVSRRTHTESAVEASPSFSPDGSRIIYTSDEAGRAQLYIMPAAGGNAQRLATGYSYAAEPDWSRGDPTKIAFTVGEGRNFQIAVYDLSGRIPAKIVSKAPLDAVEPAWLADGRHLIYTARAANSRSLYILDTETGKATPITAQGNQAEKASVWGP